MTETDTQIGGRYQIEQLLGHGGMATVHRARDTQLERDVAVKLMRADLADDAVFEARFVKEARSAASISHSNVVTVLDFGTDGPGPYIVMELVDGGDLATLIRRKGRLSVERAAWIAAEVASALEAAHRRGIVHRDVKPGNILLTSDGHPRVADFGIARATGEQSLTATGTSLGSVEYFSPEQARGEPATAASDIYALGVVLYEMLTGARPFSGEAPYAVAIARIESPPPDPRAVRPRIPKALGAVVQRAMATDPQDRFSSAAAMGRALEEWLSRRRARASRKAAAGAAAGDADRKNHSPIAATRALKKTPIAAPVRAEETMRGGAGPVAAPHALAAAGATAPAEADGAPDASAPPLRAERRGVRRNAVALLGAAAALLAVIGFASGRLVGEDQSARIVVGEPRGEVLKSTPEPTESPIRSLSAEPTQVRTPEPTPEPTQSPTPAPTQPPAPQPTPAPTPVPVAAATPPAATPAPIAVARAVTPDETVGAWYSYVANGDFDAAYALWSDRMKATYPRGENLDGRFDQTASITFQQLQVAEQDRRTAVVQANFVETYDSGSSREFIGYWELIAVDGQWLLDAPHY